MLRSVIVGIDQYSDPQITPLRFASRDAKDLAALIADRIHPEDRTVRLLLDANATKRNLMTAVGEDLARMAYPDDVILLYFAGHGSPETEGSPDSVSRYLIAHDTEYGNIYSTGIDMERELPRWFTRLGNPALVVMFIDACFSGRAGGRTFEGPGLKAGRGKNRGGLPIRLNKLALGEGRVMIAACDDDQVAREDDLLGHGVFTYCLLQALSTPRPTGSISIGKLYEEVADSVRERTNGRQIPILNGRAKAAALPSLG